MVENDAAFSSKEDARKRLKQTGDHKESPSTPSGIRLSIRRCSALSTKKEEISINVVDSDAELETSARTSSVKRDQSTMKHDVFVGKDVTLDKSELSRSVTRKSRRSSTKQNQVEENFVERYSPKTIPPFEPRSSLGSKRKIASTDSDDLSSGESVILNLSSNSSVSPIKSLPRDSLLSTDVDDKQPSEGENEAPSLRKSLLRKSLRRSKLRQSVEIKSLEDQSSSEESIHLVLSDDESASKLGERRQSQRKSRGKLSLRQSDGRTGLEKEPQNEQLLDEESFNSTSNQFVTKSRSSLRKGSRAIEEHFDMQSTCEESLHLHLSETSLNQSAERQKRLSRFKDSPHDATRKSRQHMEEGFLVSGSTNKSRRSSRSAPMAIEEQTDMLSSSEESIHPSLSESESPKQVSERSKRFSEIRDNVPIETSLRGALEKEVENAGHPNEESLETHSPPKFVRKSRQSTRKSKTAEKEETLSDTALHEELLNQDGDDESFTEELLVGPSKVDETPKERRSSAASRETSTVKDQPGFSARKRNRVSRYEESQVQGSHEANTPIDRQRQTTRTSVEINAESPLLYATNAEQRKLNELQYSSEDDSVFLVETPSDRYTPKVRHSSVRKSHLMNEADSEEEVKDAETSLNTMSSSRRSSMNKSTPINKLSKASLNISKQNISVITLNDSIDGTPENNTSVIIIDTPFEATKKSSRKRASKTFNSTIQDDTELTTPKSAIRGRRSKSLPYNPLTEDITPVTPLGDSKTENGFKTPLNTPGLFENIKKTVLKSRSRPQRSGSSLMDELNKVEPTTKAVKRARESSIGSVRSSKKRKVEEEEADNSFESDGGDVNTSFESFKTEDVLSDISEDQNVSQKTPKHFSNLTDKPVIVDPQSKSLTEPKKKKPVPLRRSLHAMRLETQTNSISNSPTKSDFIMSSSEDPSETNDSVFEVSLFSTTSIASRRSSRRASLATTTTQANNPSKKQQKSPKNDLSDVAGLKKLLRTPKEIKSPKNDLTDVRGVKKLFSTPKVVNTPKNDLRNIPNLKKWMSPKKQNSPKNDLSDVAGLKKLLSTPKNVRPPKNDLRNVPNLRKWMSPKQQNSPRNDLSDVAGLKKLLSTPKEVKSPKNDLTNVPNLRRFMYHKAQNSPRNDLSNVAGVKKLLSTPKMQNSPKNDLTNVPNLRRIMSPKQQNSPRNDLSEVHGLKRLMKTPRKIKEPVNDLTNVEGVASIFNISGVQRLSNESDIENNEDLFDKLFAKKPLRTYRGKSVSPDSRKAMDFSDHRKTVGDEPLTSPRVEKWVKEQTVMTLQTAGNPDEDNEVFEENQITKKTKGHKLVEEGNVESPKAASRGRRRKVEKKQDGVLKRAVRGRKKTEEKDEIIGDSENSVELPKRTVRGKRKLADAVDEKVVEAPEVIEKTTVVSETMVDQTEENSTELIPDEEIEFKNKQKIVRGRRKINREYGKHTALDEVITETVVVDDQEENNEAGQAKTVNEVESTNIADFKLPPAKRVRPKRTARKADMDDQIAEVHSTTEEIASTVPKRGKGGRVISDDGDISTDTEILTAPKTRERPRNSPHEEVDSTEDTAVQRGRHIKELKGENVSSPRRGRGRKKEVKDAETVDESDGLCVMVEEVPLRRHRGRNAPSVDEEPNEKHAKGKRGQNESESTPIGATNDRTEMTPTKKVVRSRRIAGKAVLNVIADEKANLKETGGKNKNEAEEETPEATEIVKNSRGRRAVQQNEREMGSPMDIRGSSESNTGEEMPKAEEVVKKPRGRRGVQQYNEESATPEVARRGRGKKKIAEEEKEDAVTKEVEPVKTTRGTRRGANLNTVEEKETRDKSPGAGKRTGKSKQKSSKVEVKDNEDKETKSKSTGTRRRLASKESEESEQKEVPVKLTNKRTRAKVLEVESPVVDSPRTREKKGNFKKYGSDFVTGMGDKKSEPKSKQTAEEREEAKGNSPVVGKKTGRNKKKPDYEDKETESTRTTRTRRRPDLKEAEESEEKEEVAVKATNKRTRAKVLKEELPVVDSPRTRARKGMFKKYGSEFVTDMGDTKSESKSKRVRFEASDTEGTSRRPKRIRK